MSSSTSTMKSRIDTLKRLALSDNDKLAKQAVSVLCSDLQLASLDIVPTLLRFLSQRRPSSLTDELVDRSPPPDSENMIAAKTFGTITLCLTKSGGSQQAVSSIREYWSALHTWASFLVTSYVHHDLIIYGDLEETSLVVMKQVLRLYVYLLAASIIRPEELEAIDGAADFFVRIHIYALLVDSSRISTRTLSSDLGVLCKYISDYSSHILSAIERDWDIFWCKIYPRSVRDFDPSLYPLMARVLSRLSLQSPLNYSILHNWFRVFARLGTVPQYYALHQRILPYRPVYFTTHIIRQISSHSKESLDYPEVFSTWRWSMQYLLIAFDYDGYDSVIVAIKSSLIRALWKIGQASVTKRMTLHPEVLQLFGDLVGAISATSLYRSIQKPLKVILDDFSLEETSEAVFKRIWGRFKNLVDERIELRRRWESLGFTFCSNTECCAPPNIKVYRCMGCTVAFYCSHVCQRSHWIQKHRQECRAHVKNRGDGIPRPLEDRDQQLADSMLESELWHIRPRLPQAQNDHRKSLPVSSATITLVTYIDISISKEKLDTRIWTLDFAKQVGPHSDLIWDEFVQTLEQEQQEGMDVGPLVLVKTPYPGPMAFKAMILSKPAIEVPSHNISPMKTYVH